MLPVFSFFGEFVFSPRADFTILRWRLIFVFIHERMFKGIRMIVLRLFWSSFGFSIKAGQSWLLLWCLISCLEAEGDSSVISIRVGKRERVLQIEVAFWNRVWKDNVFDFLIFGGGVR